MYKHNVFDLYTAVHGRQGMWVMKDERFKKSKVHDSVLLCTVVDKDNNAPDLPLLRSADAAVLVYNGVYVKWITKVEVLRGYIAANFDNLPQYIMYADAFDVCLVNDLLSPHEMLDYYGCDVLFNGEGNFSHDGMAAPVKCPDEKYWDVFYGQYGDEYKESNEIKYGAKIEKGLNAGLFVGKKQAVFDMVSKAYEYMIGDCSNGFPYGCTSDQQVLRYIQIKNYNTISVDVFNRYFFHYIYTSEITDVNDCFHFQHFDKYKEYYEHYKNRKA